MRPDDILPADLPEAARRYREAFPPGRVVTFALEGLDRTGIHAWKAALFLDDAAAMPGNMPSGYGYGATRDQAIIGAFAEVAEMLLPTLRLIGEPVVWGSYRDLSAERGASGVADPLTLCLPAGSPVDRDTRLAWTAARRWTSGESVLVPLDIAATDFFELPPGYQPFTPLITNGLGAGPDLEWAVGHGIFELLQRDGNGLGFRAMDRGIALQIDPADLEPDVRALMDRLDRDGIEAIPKFASDEFGFANLYVVGHDREGAGPRVPVMLSACGEACDPDRNAALRKAIMEFCSARVRKTYAFGPEEEALSVAPAGYIDDFLRAAQVSLDGGENRARDAMLSWTTMDADDLRRELADVYAVRSTHRFADLPQATVADTRERGRIAVERLTQAGFDVLVVDGSPRDGSVGVAKVIVPGLEVETLSYYRIGERNARRLIERGSPLIRFGEPSERLRPVRLTPEALARLGGRQPLLDTDEVDRTVGHLYPLYREPEAHHIGQILKRGGAAETAA
ncbi:YcaO-like family protein [Aureimonas jatrophae]|uniref:Ribosomal protein S12 methylthiotransferase accessory factor n=1 Tax=Aureimonas jatrophae TaxID=1166073 RepID=A0A1H0HXG0_9HYPH|nr:YcaO-like family protein [Aureimonas jatrophae]MBB3950826.1 ribosomal protein S12 methylthiotransferase accessory factor [Aureimonas jatrophae]SDO23844.1 ribosomal protein S12 methylthiotransferase accessory factor [Aureimonas jatrophae]